jgi:hypothetical protein
MPIIATKHVTVHMPDQGPGSQIVEARYQWHGLMNPCSSYRQWSLVSPSRLGNFQQLQQPGGINSFYLGCQVAAATSALKLETQARVSRHKIIDDTAMHGKYKKKVWIKTNLIN